MVLMLETKTNSLLLMYAVPLPSAIVFGVLSTFLTRCFKTRLPNERMTLQELVERVVGLNAATLLPENSSPSKDDVWIILRAIIVNQFDVKFDAVVPNAKFVKDLGLN